MEMQVSWADRAHPLEVGAVVGRDEPSALLVVSRGASMAFSSPAATCWLVLRGEAETECREGHFRLGAGDWLALERESRPTLYAGTGAVVVGIALSATMQLQLQQSAQAAVFPGRGRLPARSRAMMARLWRRSAAFARNESRGCEADRRQLGQILRSLAGLQQEFRGMVDRCPGRSLRRKRQVFARMQRARLYLEGNVARAVRIPELAELSSMSVWYFTKTFHALYGEGPQAASTRIRLRHAGELLLQTRWSVSEVGAACGFENNCSFSRAFRAQYGMPPSLYRFDGDRQVRTDGANAADMHRQAGMAWAP